MPSPVRSSREDPFAQIGRATPRADAPTALREPAPPRGPWPQWRLTPARGPAPAAANPELSPAQLARELQRLRRRFAPFLRQLTPKAPRKRPTQPLSHAEWRLISAHDREQQRRHRGWKRVALPHYGPPIGPAHAVYRFRFRTPRARAGQNRGYLCFGAVDYHAEVFLNGTRLGAHEGFFAPFEFDATTALRRGWNTLLVHVRNDAVCMGNRSWGQALEGDKLYAATGPGWDAAGSGWHHCPAGMGIWQPVRFEWRAPLHLADVWVRPLWTQRRIEVRAEVQHCDAGPVKLALQATVRGRNYRLRPIEGAHPAPADAQHGRHHYRFEIALPDAARAWSPDAPWLHDLEVRLLDDSNRVVDVATTTFGLRAFVIDENTIPRGQLRLNGIPLRLRGANTMGFEQQRVLRGERDGLIDDLLLARFAGMNFLRFTQRPVQPEVYALCDALGLLTQTDLPLFGVLRRTQFHEALRQAGEMERLIRSHASAALVSFINEPFPASWGERSHRHLDREELTRFLDAATLAVRHENPDRQVKPVDGDYDPPHAGLPDNHAYPGWYNGHAIDLGRLHRGHWVAVKDGWLHACGEFGSEGLDPAELMRRRYPRAWLPRRHDVSDEREWTPARIHHAQTGEMYPLWFDRQETLADWCAFSRAHQAWITRLMTEAFRRDERMVSFAIHHFIDAFPAGWMKSIVDCERRPKPAFHAYRAALAPVLVSLRSDRLSGWSGDALPCEVWLCNDFPAAARVTVQLSLCGDDGRLLARSERTVEIRALASRCVGEVRVRCPRVDQRRELRLHARVRDDTGRVLSENEHTFSVFARPPQSPPRALRWIGAADSAVRELLRRDLALPHAVNGTPRAGELLVGDDPARLSAAAAAMPGATCLVLNPPPGQHRVGVHAFTVEPCGFQPRHFVSRRTGHPLVAGFTPRDFCFWHGERLDRPSPLLHRLFFAESWKPILATGQCDWGQPLRLAHAAAESPDGRVRVCTLELAGRTRTNPVAHLFAQRLLQGDKRV